IRRSARGIPTAFSSSSARARACFFVTSRWSWIASTSCAPIRCTGFSDVIGSWKIIAMSFPRMSRRRLALIVSRFSPLKIASPLEIVFRFGLSPMIVRQVRLLPEPDSPTMPSVSPFSIEKLTPSTALTIPSSVRKWVLRSRTSRRAIRSSLRKPDPWVDPGVEEVDEEVEDDDRERREHDHPLDGRDVVVEEPADRGPPQAGQAVDGLREDGSAEREADVHPEHRHDREHGVPQDVRAEHE